MLFPLLLLTLLFALLAILLIRTLCFTPKQTSYPSEPIPEFDRDGAVEALAQLIRCRTVSSYRPEEEDEGEFVKLHRLLPQLYPSVFASCSTIPLPDRALLLKWEGKQHNAPSVMMAHYDVVPADEKSWEKPPFDGILENGVLWGRGTLDTKCTFNAIFSASQCLIDRGFVPEQDVYLAFSGGEEVNGPGAVRIVQWFTENDIRPALVVDEGGAVVENVFPGVKQPCGLIGIGEKGYMNCTFTAKSAGGHASSPAPHTPIGILSAACCSIENHPFPCT